MPKWEYGVLNVRVSGAIIGSGKFNVSWQTGEEEEYQPKDHPLHSILNERGQEGWEMVGIVYVHGNNPVGTYYFKRQI
jgi:hypothetical protein